MEITSTELKANMMLYLEWKWDFRELEATFYHPRVACNENVFFISVYSFHAFIFFFSKIKFSTYESQAINMESTVPKREWRNLGELWNSWRGLMRPLRLKICRSNKHVLPIWVPLCFEYVCRCDLQNINSFKNDNEILVTFWHYIIFSLRR